MHAINLAAIRERLTALEANHTTSAQQISENVSDLATLISELVAELDFQCRAHESLKGDIRQLRADVDHLQTWRRYHPPHEPK